MAWYNPISWFRSADKAEALLAELERPAPVQKGRRFTALRDFYSPDTRSDYIEGLGYTVRPGNDKLSALVDQWIADGKVREGGPASRVAGRARAN